MLVFGNEGEIGLCFSPDNGPSPYQHYLDLEGEAEILEIDEASPLWKTLLEEIDQKRSIYRIVDEEEKSWMELVIIEEENEE